MAEQDFIKAGFTVVGTENHENKLLNFLKENYPNVIRDTEINLEELKTVLSLPIDEKVNGYGLNFVGRNFARAKYAQKTEKELRLNNTLSKNIDTTENLVLKGDNLDSLKILKNHYSGQVKCIYIDPPYNTESDEFVYPDKFDKEEAEVLGLANLSESDFARMDFSFKTKKSHNGWLAFMYPRLLLARDLLSKDGVIFISIDDNEQANLKLLCDDVFGEENYVAQLVWKKKTGSGSKIERTFSEHEYILAYVRDSSVKNKWRIKDESDGNFQNPDNDERGAWESCAITAPSKNRNRNQLYKIEVHFSKSSPIDYKLDDIIRQFKYGNDWIVFRKVDGTIISDEGYDKQSNIAWFIRRWAYVSDSMYDVFEQRRVYLKNSNLPRFKKFETEYDGKAMRSIYYDEFSTQQGGEELKELLGSDDVLQYPKPIDLIKMLIEGTTTENNIILDFFAGSGTTGQAVMELNKDGGNRRYILCQKDETIDPAKKKEAYDFCIANNLEPVISSITIERLKRAGEKITKDIETENSKSGMFEEDKKQVPDIGFKVFDSVEAPKLKVDDKGQISITENDTDALSRIYNMIFTVGLDEPTQVPEEVVKDCIYKIGNHYYITNSEKITSDDYSNSIKNGKVFIDGWTASLNGTLQNYKEDVKIVF